MSIKKTKFRRTDLRLKNRRGFHIECSHFETVDQRTQAPCVIYLHANGCSRIESMEYLELIGLNGMSLFCFDFSGSGLSEGTYCSLGWFEQDDLECVIEYLASNGKTSRIALWGRSMGAITALLYAKRDPRITCMVLDSPFTSFTQFAKDFANRRASIPGFVTSAALSILRSSIKSRANFDIDSLNPIKHAPTTKIPAIFAAAEGDTFVLPSHSLQLYESYGGLKKKHIIFAGDHNSPRPPKFLTQVVDFLKNHLFEPLSERRMSVLLNTTQESRPSRCSEVTERSKNCETVIETPIEKKKLNFVGSTPTCKENTEQSGGSAEEGEEKPAGENSQMDRDIDTARSGTNKTERINYASSKTLFTERNVGLSFTWTTNHSVPSQNLTKVPANYMADKGERSSTEEIDTESIGAENCASYPNLTAYQSKREENANVPLTKRENGRESLESYMTQFNSRIKEKTSPFATTKMTSHERNISLQISPSMPDLQVEKNSLPTQSLVDLKISEFAPSTETPRNQATMNTVESQLKIPTKPTSKIIDLARSKVDKKPTAKIIGLARSVQSLQNNVENPIYPSQEASNDVHQNRNYASTARRGSFSSTEYDSLIYSEENQVSTKQLPNDLKANSTSRGEVDSIAFLPKGTADIHSIPANGSEFNCKCPLKQIEINVGLSEKILSAINSPSNLEPSRLNSPHVISKGCVSSDSKQPHFFSAQTNYILTNTNTSRSAMNSYTVQQSVNSQRYNFYHETGYQSQSITPTARQQYPSFQFTAGANMTDFSSYYTPTYNHQNPAQTSRNKENLTAISPKYRFAEYTPTQSTNPFYPQ